MTLVYAAGIPVFFYVLAKVYKVDQIARMLTTDEYVRALLVAFTQDARALHGVFTKSSAASGAGATIRTQQVLTMCTNLLNSIRESESESNCCGGKDAVDEDDDENRAQRLCPACEKVAAAWEHTGLPAVNGTSHLRVLADKLILPGRNSSNFTTVESMVSTVTGTLEDADLLMRVHCVEDLTEPQLRVLARQDWHTIVPQRKETCYKCTHSVQVG